MSLLTAKLNTIGDKANSEAMVLFDTGASHSFILRALAERIATISPLPRPLLFTLGDGRTITVSDQATVIVEIPGTAVLDTMMVIDAGVEEIVLGASTMRKFGLKLDMEHSTVFAEIKEELVLPHPIPQPKEGRAMTKALQALLKRLEIEATEDMTDEQAMAAIVELKTSAPEPAPEPAPVAPASAAVLSLLELKETASEDEIQGKILALKNPGNVVPAEELQTLQAKLAQRDIEDAVSAALQEGKILPAEKAGWLEEITEGRVTLATFQSFVANRPKLVPLANLPKAESHPEQSPLIDETQAAINQQLGVSPEIFAKYNQE